ncbi:Co-chaperone Hsc20, partial [Thozetella sp. PMI_491]
SRKASTAQGKTPAGTARQTPPRFYALFPETLPAGPPPAGPFRVDVRALRREFLRLQAAAHPDFHHAASGASDVQAASRARAEAASALINEAYKTLSSPLLRAQYLLRELHDADLAGDEAGAAAEADPELLGLVLEAREAIEEAADERDLAELQRENDERIRLAEEGLEAAFCTGDISAAKAEAVRLRYWTNIKQSLEDWENGKPVVLQH